MKKAVTHWECPCCGNSTKKTRIRLYEDETNCPRCGFDKLRTWTPPSRGRPKKNKKTYTMRLSAKTRELLERRQDMTKLSFGDLVDQAVAAQFGDPEDRSLFKKLHAWPCLLHAEKRKLTEEELEMIEEIFETRKRGAQIDSEVWTIPEVGEVYTILKLAEEVKKLHVPVADEATQALCGLLCAKDGYPPLWAYTLYRMFLEKDQDTLTLEDFVHSFAEGIPTYQSMVFAWKFQGVYVVREGKNIDYARNPRYWPDKIR